MHIYIDVRRDSAVWRVRAQRIYVLLLVQHRYVEGRDKTNPRCRAKTKMVPYVHTRTAVLGLVRWWWLAVAAQLRDAGFRCSAQTIGTAGSLLNSCPIGLMSFVAISAHGSSSACSLCSSASLFGLNALCSSCGLGLLLC